MITVEDVNRFFEERDAWMRRMLRPALVTDERIQDAVALVYYDVSRNARNGKIADAGDLVAHVKECLWWSIRRVRRGQGVDYRGRRRRDVMTRGRREPDRDPRDTPLIEEVAYEPEDPAESAALRIDLAVFLARLPARTKLMMLDMAAGWRNPELVAKYGVSPTRVSQIRRLIRELWDEFQTL